MSIISYFDTGK